MPCLTYISPPVPLKLPGNVQATGVSLHCATVSAILDVKRVGLEGLARSGVSLLVATGQLPLSTSPSRLTLFFLQSTSISIVNLANRNSRRLNNARSGCLPILGAK